MDFDLIFFPKIDIYRKKMKILKFKVGSCKENIFCAQT